MKYIQIICFSLITLLSCKNETKGICCTNIESVISIGIKDPNGNDLLSPTNNKIDFNTIKIKYLNKKGEKELVNNPNLDAFSGYTTLTPEMIASDHYKIQVFLNTDYIDNDNFSYTYINWVDDDIDEIKTEFNITNNSIIMNKIFVNNVLFWKKNNPKEIFIVK